MVCHCTAGGTQRFITVVVVRNQLDGLSYLGGKRICFAWLRMPFTTGLGAVEELIEVLVELVDKTVVATLTTATFAD